MQIPNELLKSTLLNNKLMEKNRDYWSADYDAELRYYRHAWEDNSMEKVKIRFGGFSGVANVAVRTAFSFMMAERPDLYHLLIDLAIEAAHEALRTHDFAPPPQLKPTPRNVECAIAYGTMDMLSALQYATWFKTGQRPLDILRQCVEAWRKYLELAVDHSVEPMIEILVEAGYYEEALALFRSAFKEDKYDAMMTRYEEEEIRGLKTPNRLAFARSETRTLAVLASFLAGNKARESIARDSTRMWYRKAMIWDSVASYMYPSHKDHLRWAYLWHTHFTGVSDLQVILQDLRGY
jgi:hypothetical protein